MQFIDLQAQQRQISAQLHAAMGQVLQHGKYILGPEVSELEHQLARFAGVEHCVACANGTDALVLALRALGISNGDAVLTPAFTFFASAEAIALVGARPVFVDIDPETYNVDVDSVAQQYQGHDNIRALIAVDLFGQLADYERLGQFCSDAGIHLIEDAAQSFGATNHLGQKAGSFGAIATTSFFPAKPLGCYGDGGALFCSDADIAAKLKSLRVHGQANKGQADDKYHNQYIGLNSRLDSLQAAILLEKLKIFPEELELREQVAQRYQSLLQHPKLVLPQVRAGNTSSWAQYTIACPERDRVIAHMQQAGIPHSIYYPVSLHQQPAFAYLEIDYCLPVCEDLQEQVFSIPMHPYLTAGQQQAIAQTIFAALEA